MSWRTFRPGFLQRKPVATTYGGIVHESIRRAAEEYAAGLQLGDEIVEATDGKYIDPFRVHLPQALARRGLCLGQTSRGWVIERAPFPPLPAPAAECTECHRSWMHPECAHGVGVEMLINWGDA